MSECVVRMRMPTENTVCELNYYSNSYYSIGYRGEWRCTITDNRCDHNKNGELPSWCPIICQLPDGHGRLVDADKLADDMKARKAFFGRMSDPQCLVEDTPTIVPAEKSET